MRDNLWPLTTFTHSWGHTQSRKCWHWVPTALSLVSPSVAQTMLTGTEMERRADKKRICYVKLWCSINNIVKQNGSLSLVTFSYIFIHNILSCVSQVVNLNPSLFQWSFSSFMSHFLSCVYLKHSNLNICWHTIHTNTWNTKYHSCFFF